MTTSSGTQRSRRERPAKPALTRDGIIAATVAILRTEGLRRVTMRRLADDLDTGAASLYVYIRNTAELHAAILDVLLGEVDLRPVRGEGDWRERLESVLVSYTTVLFEHPSLARAALVARPSGANYLALLDALLTLLDEGGVPSGQAAWGVDLLLQYATATAAEHAGQPPSDWDTLASAVRATTRPRLLAVADELFTGAPEVRLSWGFQVLINGISQTTRGA